MTIATLIEKLQEDISWLGYNETEREIIEHIKCAITLLKEQEAVKPKWTSIKKCYPEKEGFYLVSADNGNYHPWIAEMRIFKGIKGFCNGATMPCVVAWMPLPKIPGEEDI